MKANLPRKFSDSPACRGGRTRPSTSAVVTAAPPLKVRREFFADVRPAWSLLRFPSDRYLAAPSRSTSDGSLDTAQNLFLMTSPWRPLRRSAGGISSTHDRQ